MAPLAATDDRLPVAETDRPVRCGSNARWHVAQTHPQAERWAVENLSRQGFVSYLPLAAIVVRDRVLRTLTRTVLRPLFSSYLFVAFDAERDPWRPICSTRGVRRLFMTGFRPLPVPHGAVERLQATEPSRLSSSASAASWAPGTACVLAAGPFTGLAAVIVDTAEETARVTLLVFNELRDVTVPVAHLAAPTEG